MGVIGQWEPTNSMATVYCGGEGMLDVPESVERVECADNGVLRIGIEMWPEFLSNLMPLTKCILYYPSHGHITTLVGIPRQTTYQPLVPV
jgi:hypothetical protein